MSIANVLPFYDRYLRKKDRMENLFNLTNKVAIVTGGGGILGKGFSTVLAAHGANVAVVDLDADAAHSVADELVGKFPNSKAIAISADVSDPTSVEAMVRQVSEQFGQINILHNNAASKSKDLDNFFAAFEDYSLEQWREIMAVNIDGMFLVAQAVGKQMCLQNTGGSIIQTSSIYGVAGVDQRIYEGSRYYGRQINTPAVYSTSKAAVIGLTQYLATYWGEKNIRVNTLTPGGVESGQNDEFKRRYAQRVPLGRLARIDEMQAALLFLASDASSYMTGQNIIVDGGLTCW